MTELLDRITVNLEQCGGQPCIRGMRVRVVDILNLLAAGFPAEYVLEELPDLEMDDVKAALEYAARRLDEHAPTTASAHKQPDGGLMSKLRAITIQGPEDFSANVDLYLTGEKKITNGEID